MMGTSVAAIQSLPGSVRLNMRERILAFIGLRGADGATCDEIEVAMNLSHQSASARVHELAEAKKIVPGGQRITRSGRKATAWTVPQAGQLEMF